SNRLGLVRAASGSVPVPAPVGSMAGSREAIRSLVTRPFVIMIDHRVYSEHKAVAIILPYPEGPWQRSGSFSCFHASSEETSGRTMTCAQVLIKRRVFFSS